MYGRIRSVLAVVGGMVAASAALMACDNLEQTPGELPASQPENQASAAYLTATPTRRHPVGLVRETPEFVLGMRLPMTQGSVTAAAALPASVDLSARLPPVGDQGTSSSCVAWAVSYATKSLHEVTEFQWSPLTTDHQFSPSWVYNQLNGGSPRGISISSAMNLIVNNGVDTIDNFPFDQNDWKRQPDTNSKVRAVQYKAKSYNSVQVSEQSLKTLLAGGNAVTISFEVLPDIDDMDGANNITYDTSNGTRPVDTSPACDANADSIAACKASCNGVGKCGTCSTVTHICTVPACTTPPCSRGGHAVAVIGYNDANKAFRFINSWGNTWNGNGYGWLAYSFINNANLKLVAWVMTDANSKTAPAAIRDPFVSVYNSQQHVAYRDASGTVQDVYYDGTWKVRALSTAGMTAGPSAFVQNNQQHFVYRDGSGALWDSYYANGTWLLQKLTMSGLTAAPAAAGSPFTSVLGNTQQHITYRDSAGAIWDVWYDTAWHYQQINLGGKTAAPAAAGDPFVSFFGGQQHVFYRDASRKIWDVWYAGSWNYQQINLGGKTQAPAAIGDPVVMVTSDGSQQHVIYRDSSWLLQDAYFAANTWRQQTLNSGGAPAVGRPFAIAFNNQQHIVYPDIAGVVWDVWYDGSWHTQQINMGGKTLGPAAAGDAFFSVYSGQQHVTYRDVSGNLWDSWYDGSWHLQLLI